MKKKRSLVSCIQEFWPATILTPIFVIGEVAFDVLIPLMTGRLLDEGVRAGSMDHIIRYGLTVVGMAILALICGGLSGRFGAKASTGFARNLRREMYKNVQQFSFSNIDKFSTSGIITRLTTDVTNVMMAFMMIIRIAVRSPIMLICAWVLTLRINPRLALVFLVIIPILAVGLLLIMTKAHPIFERVFKRYDHLNNVVQENVHGIRVVKSFVREDRETEKFTSVSGTIYKDFCKAERIMSLANPIMQLCVYGCMLAISWIGAHLVIASGNNPDLGLTTGQLSSMFTYTTQILSSLMMLSMVFVMLSMSVASAERVSEVLNETPDIVNPENPVYKVKDGSIVFDHVSFRYNKEGKKNVLNDIDLSIKEGETIGIIGGTGSAKSSLVNLISRLYDVSEGRLLVGGKDVREYDIETLRDEVSVVLQKNVLFSGTILDNLRWGDENATEEECKRACHLACADEFIDRMPDGYHTYIEQGGSNVSGGQKQRLCIARALLKKPKILILDDSTSAVDTATDAKIREAFAKEIPDTTKLIIAQRVSSIQSADRIIVMDNGEISGFDTHENLMKSNEIYRDVYESQTKGGGDFDENGGE